MKIRIHDNSIRLRLNRDEVNQVGRFEGVECTTGFPAGETFAYQLRVSAAAAAVTASFSDGTIALELTEAAARHWADTETEVAIAVDVPIAAGTLSLLVEKDFECLEPRAGEDQSNRFRNPKAVVAE